MAAATSRRPVKYRNHCPRPTLSNISTIAAAPASLALPAAKKATATRPERVQRVIRRPLPEAAGSVFVVIIRFPFEQDILLTSIYLKSMVKMRSAPERTQKNARYFGGYAGWCARRLRFSGFRPGRRRHRSGDLLDRDARHSMRIGARIALKTGCIVLFPTSQA